VADESARCGRRTVRGRTTLRDRPAYDTVQTQMQPQLMPVNAENHPARR
jgi:hypothetical protein